MKLLILFFSSLMLGPLVAFFLTSGAAPAWFLVSALAFATIVGISILAQQWLRILGIVALRVLLVVPALVVTAACVYALATLPPSHWILWAVLATALFTLLVGATLDSRPRSMGRPRTA